MDPTVRLSVPVSMSGTICSRSMQVGGTVSIQTVCQIPVVGVYQIPRGRLTCLPRG